MSSLRFEDAWRCADQFEGWLTKPQGRALYDAASEVAAGDWIVEIGSHCGRSTVLLAAAKQENVRVLAVDPFDDPRWGGGPEAFHTFQSNLQQAGLLDCVQVFRGLSAQAAHESAATRIGLLFIDGAHDEPSVITDIDGWSPRLQPGAVVFLHDAYSSPGVTTALFKRFFGIRSARYMGSHGSLARIDVVVVGAVGRLRSMGGMALRLGWFARNLVVKVALRRRWFVVSRLLLHRGHDYPY